MLAACKQHQFKSARGEQGEQCRARQLKPVRELEPGQ